MAASHFYLPAQTAQLRSVAASEHESAPEETRAVPPPRPILRRCPPPLCTHPPLLSQAVRRNAHMTPIRRSCPVSLRRPARVRSKELAGSDRVGPLYRLFRSAFGSGSAHSPRLYAAGGHTARMRSRSRSARRSSFLSSPFVVRFWKFRKFRLSFA